MLELRKLKLDTAYCKKWNSNLADYFNLYKDGIKVNDAPYRIGGLNNPKLNVDSYFMLLKYVESFYSDEITKDPLKKPHLDGQWCIIDKNGEEKIVFKSSLDCPYLMGGVVYVSNKKYYNIETKELYCESYEAMNTDNFIFLHNKFDKDESKRGVLKVNKLDGSFELIK